METPEEIRSLVDQLGQAMVQAIMADEAGHSLVAQIQETGFEVGIMLEATIALHKKDSESTDGPQEAVLAEGCFFTRQAPGSQEPKNFEWSEEDRALMCNFRIALD